jgi:hypothetical protein
MKFTCAISADAKNVSLVLAKIVIVQKANLANVKIAMPVNAVDVDVKIAKSLADLMQKFLVVPYVIIVAMYTNAISCIAKTAKIIKKQLAVKRAAIVKVMVILIG